MTDSHIQAIREVYARADRIYSQQDIEAAYNRMAAQITARLSDSNPLVLCVMVGGLIPAGQLLPRLDFPLQIDYIHATRYQGKTQGGQLHWIVRPTYSLQDRVVLLIDDILDEGVTLKALCEACADAGAAKYSPRYCSIKSTTARADWSPPSKAWTSRTAMCSVAAWIIRVICATCPVSTRLPRNESQL